MKKLTGCLLTFILCISASAEQPDISKKSLLESSESLASEMGRTFQLAKNCQQDMSNISADSAVKFFKNYFAEHEVEIIMKQYMLFASQEKGKLCEREKIKFYKLMNKMAIYIRSTRRLTNKADHEGNRGQATFIFKD